MTHLLHKQEILDFVKFFEGPSWGSHLCHFYKSKTELLEVLLPYFADGLLQNELCVWITAGPLTPTEARSELAKVVPALASHEEAGDIIIMSHKDWYFNKEGKLKATNEILTGWLNLEGHALDNNYNGIRVTGNVEFLHNESDWKDFMHYECFVCENLDPHHIKAICSYPLDKNTDPLTISEVVLNHQAILSKKEGEWVLTENPQNKKVKQIKKQQEELSAIAKRLKSSNEELARFAYVASHDLKEPVRMISCYTEILSERYADKLDFAGQEFLKFTNEAANRSQQLIHDLLEFAKLDQSNEELQDVDCNVVLETVLENLRLTINGKGAKVTSEFLPIVKGNESQLRQLFQNLISNALKFNKSEQPKVHITCEKKDKQYVFCITDNGIGIEKNFIDKLFVVFKRLHSKEEFEGNGIGLAICKKIVEKHSGNIWVVSEPEKGSEFTFSLPVPIEIYDQNGHVLNWEHTLCDHANGNHVMHVYEDKSSLNKTVSYFIEEGIKNSEGVLVVARKEHINMFKERLGEHENLLNLKFIDADEILKLICQKGKISGKKFDEHIGDFVRKAQEKHPTLRIYGEIVDILCENNQEAEAIRLERQWNKLAAEVPFKLFCAYDEANVTNKEGGHSAVLKICQTHSHVLPRSLKV